MEQSIINCVENGELVRAAEIISGGMAYLGTTIFICLVIWMVWK